MKLRDYQKDIIDRVDEHWENGKQTVLVQLETGGGKTLIVSDVVKNHAGPSLVLAHRSELVSQTSLTLAKNYISHKLIVQAQNAKDIKEIHKRQLNECWVIDTASNAAASVDTIIRREIAEQYTLVVIDEAHHVTQDNKWGKLHAMFPNAKFLHMTATPERLDGKGLARHADGFVDAMVQGPTMSELMQQGYLAGYQLKAPPNLIDFSCIRLASNGEYNFEDVRRELQRAKITGGAVEQYLKFAEGKSGITFTVDISSAQEVADAYNAAGIRAEVISSLTPTLQRAQFMQEFRERKILQLVNVDIFTEGTDVPEIEVISMLAPTKSYGRYKQMIGRCLRPAPGKTHGIILDHVGNCVTHGRPDDPKIWSLERRERRTSSVKSSVQVKICDNPECLSVYERVFKACTYCGKVPEIADRSAPQFVDGDLTELDPNVLSQLRAEIKRIDADCRVPTHLPAYVQSSIRRKHKDRQDAQKELRGNMKRWASTYKSMGCPIDEIYRRFFINFGIDVATAQTLGSRPAIELSKKLIDFNTNKV